jgi:hypothetical protein
MSRQQTSEIKPGREKMLPENAIRILISPTIPTHARIVLTDVKQPFKTKGFGARDGASADPCQITNRVVCCRELEELHFKMHSPR